MNSDGMPGVTLHAETAPKLNFASHQSSFAFLRELAVENNSAVERLESVRVTLESDPGFLRPKSWVLDRLPPGATVPIEERDIRLDGAFLLDLSDAVSGHVAFRAERDGVTVAEEIRPVELLAYNEWGGAGFMPELLAAFSMPNEPAVDRILRDASLLLRKAGRPDGIDGYQSGSRKRVWELASAIYTAVCNLRISYAAPPASFERDGQKIRLPGHILEARIATCLDSAMLFASALEQAGLNSLVALPEGHAVAGVWLQPEDLTNVVIDEAEVLRKRIQLDELLLFETTFVTAPSPPSFKSAITAATDVIAPDNDDTFVAAVDVRRARAQRILPLGRKSAPAAGELEEEQAAPAGLLLEEAPSLPGFDSGWEQEELPQTPEGRLERWQRKLLDLSARNPLLNHRSTTTSLELICPEPGLLEDKLAAQARISIRPAREPTSRTQDEGLHAQRTGEVISREFARETLEKNAVLVDLGKEELSRRAVAIYRKAQTALQEGGANTLYLALGFLLWKREEKDRKRFRAPLILLPVTLMRKSVRSGVRMLAHDDEPRFNTTLLEMLRKDFSLEIGGLDGALPADARGVDVEGIWTTMRKAVKDVPGFEVTEDVVLGHFSFAKYLMWKDLVDRTEALRSSPVVRHLIDSPRDPYPSDIPFVESRDLDSAYSPSDLLVPLPADSSQMAAIATADRGKDFVIIGPPGTGKSQTISNLIVHMLGKGKSVLFVSEKTAALDVVHRRIKEIGLGRFCLELHSNKARKQDVLNQLEQAWSRLSNTDGTTWRKEAERLKGLRDRLNLVVHRLHTRRRNGMTAFEAMGVRIRDEQLASRVAFSWPAADQHDEAQLEAMRSSVQKLRVQASAIEGLADSPFRLVAHGDWSPRWEDDLAECAGALAAAALELQSECDAFLAALGMNLADRTPARMDALADLARVLQESLRKQTAYALEADGPERIEALGEAATRLDSYRKGQAALSCPYEPTAWRRLDGEAIGKRWQEAEASWLGKRILLRRRVVKDMKEGGARGTPDPGRDWKTLAGLRRDGEAIARLDPILTGFKDWRRHATDPDTVRAMRELGERTRSAVQRLADDTPSLLDARKRLKALLGHGNDLLAPDAPVGRAAERFLHASAQLKQASAAFEGLAGQPVREHFAEEANALRAVREQAEAILLRRHELRAWCDWRRRRKEAVDLGLAPVVDAIEDGRVPVQEVEQTFEAAYCHWWSGRVIGEDEVLRTFSTAEHVDTIERFRQIDNRFQELTAGYVEAGLCGQIPASDSVTRKSSWGVLRHEIQKKRRHKPVRQLMAEIPDVVTTLAPCLMMSPLSVAQYLAADQALFDVVIFDEASQITVWDAAGCLARGRQAIIVGDPKQMPPTNFFARSDDDPDEDIDAEGDLESILDELLAASIPERTLRLHYRSRKESLIAFSNSQYYRDELVTFPAPAWPDNGVLLVRPEGVYSRGKARHNRGEADAIVEEILRRLTHRDADVRKQSIGVVTFNSEQQTLIEDLLDAARSEDPGIEWAFAEEGQMEPVFVKNLETVQGDERDVIMFSITYGPDHAGHVTMNFGPLNRDGGERRLNVAVTRSRSEMLVFSTLSPDHIDLSRTQARAVADLKHFLQYAERGPAALGAQIHGSIGDLESPFEVAVARALEDKGWEVHPQVGVSRYRIDLGVVHPDARGTYLAGVECDGAMYHSSAFARERDKIRQAVLEGLGWTLFRIWSTDWWTHKATALETLHGSLTRRLETDRREREQAAGARDHQDTLSGVGAAPASEDAALGQGTSERTSPAAKAQSPSASSTESPPLGTLAPYVEWTPTNSVVDPRSARTRELAALLAEVVGREGPIVALRAYRAINRASGSRRLTRPALAALDRACDSAVRRGLVLAGNPLKLSGRAQLVLRNPGSPEVVLRQRGPRQLDELPPDEVAAMLRALSGSGGSVNKEDLKRQALERLGWGRLARNISDFLDRCATLV